MNTLQKALLSASFAGVVVLAFALFNGAGSTTVVKEVPVGASSGPEKTEHQTFLNSFTKGGRVVATSSTASTFTLTTAELNRNTSYLDWTVNVNTTLTTMASTSAPFSNLAVGESLEVYFYNASSSAAATATFAAGTGVDLQEDEGETVVVNGLELARLTFVKKNDTDVALWVEVGQVGD